MVPGRGVQGGQHARGHPHFTFLPHRPAVRAARLLPEGYRAENGHLGGEGQRSPRGRLPQDRRCHPEKSEPEHDGALLSLYRHPPDGPRQAGADHS